MFTDADIADGYQLDLHAHDVPLIRCFLAEHQGRDLHVIERKDTPDPEPLLPWDPGDAWLVDEAIRASKPATETPKAEPAEDRTLPLLVGV